MTLVAAVSLAREDQVRANLYWGCDVAQVDKQGITALEWAVRLDRVDDTKALLAAGAHLSPEQAVGTVRGTDRNGNPVAVGIEAAQVVLDHFSRGNLNRYEVVCAAVQNGSPEIIDYLIRRGVNPNVTDADGRFPAETPLGWTALHYLAHNFDPAAAPAAQALIRAGGNVDLPDASGETPLSIAQDVSDQDAIAFFQSKSSQPQTAN